MNRPLYNTLRLQISPSSFYFIKLVPFSDDLHSDQGGNPQESLLPIRIPAAFIMLPVYICIATFTTINRANEFLKDPQYHIQCKCSPGVPVVLSDITMANRQKS